MLSTLWSLCVESPRPSLLRSQRTLRHAIGGNRFRGDFFSGLGDVPRQLECGQCSFQRKCSVEGGCRHAHTTFKWTSAGSNAHQWWYMCWYSPDLPHWTPVHPPADHRHPVFVVFMILLLAICPWNVGCAPIRGRRSTPSAHGDHVWTGSVQTDGLVFSGVPRSQKLEAESCATMKDVKQRSCCTTPG